MNTTILYITLGAIVGIIIGYLIAKIIFIGKVKGHRQDSVKRSRAVVLGQVNEKIAPLLPNFPYNYKDLVFIGKGIDYIVFDGLSEGKLKKIVFLEVKTGNSRLNRNEESIKDSVKHKFIYYEIFRI